MADNWERVPPKGPSPAVKKINEMAQPAVAWERAPRKAESEYRTNDQLTAEDDPFVTGLLQGGTFGWWDELASRAESAIADTDYRANWERRQSELDR